MTLRRWWPPLAWMGAILTATSIPGVYIPAVGPRNLDKVVHLFLYGVLGFLVSRSLDDPTKRSRLRAMATGFAFCVILGAADEWHQLYIPGRSAEVGDWIADSSGGLLGAATWALLRRNKQARTA